MDRKLKLEMLEYQVTIYINTSQSGESKAHDEWIKIWGKEFKLLVTTIAHFFIGMTIVLNI